MIKSFILKKTRILFLLVICLIFANAAISYSSILKLNANQQIVNHSNEIIIRLEKTLSAFKNAQAARYNYLISTNIDYLKSYELARKQININVQSLKSLTENSYQTRPKILLIDTKINNQLELFSEKLNIKQNNPVNISDNLALNNHVTKLIYELEKAEKKVLSNRIHLSKITFYKAIIAFLIAGFGNLALVTQLYFLLKHYAVKLKKTQAALRQSENRLQAIIDAKPESIELIDMEGTLLEINAFGIGMMEVESADVLIGRSLSTVITPEYQ
ncbi:MAG: CHASE3 domain-containing protein, partial [Rivularia sp. (in: cyanobacteria)]